MATGRTNEALLELARVTDEHPIASQARLWEGQLELHRQRARAAEASLRRAIAIDPGLVAARRELVYLYGMQRRCEDLSAQFTALAELAPMTFEQVTLWCLIGALPGTLTKSSRFSRHLSKPTQQTGRRVWPLRKRMGVSDSTQTSKAC